MYEDHESLKAELNACNLTSRHIKYHRYIIVLIPVGMHSPHSSHL